MLMAQRVDIPENLSHTYIVHFTEPMQFQVAHIEFDFQTEDNEFPPLDYQQAIVEETKQKVWEVDDEEYLTDAISDCFGWCVDTIIYNEV